MVGGNVSLYNESPEGAIDPTPTVSAVGLIEDERHITRQQVNASGLRLFLLGGAPDELGGSQFLGLVHRLKTGDAPAIDLEAEKRLQDFLLHQIRSGRVQAAHDLSEGGLLVAACEMLFAPAPAWGEKAPGWGADLDLVGLETGRTDALLFGESQGRVWVAVAPADADRFAAEAAAAGVPAAAIGVVTDDGAFSVATRGGRIAWPVAELRRGWETSIEEAMKRPGLE